MWRGRWPPGAGWQDRGMADAAIDDAALDGAALDVVAWVHADAGRVLTVRSRGRDLLYLPGGKREAGEDDWTAISREVLEELGVALDRSSFGLLGVVRAAAHDQPDYDLVRMSCFTAGYTGTLRACAEVSEYRYLLPADRALLSPASQAALDLAIARGLPTRAAAGGWSAQDGDGARAHGQAVAGMRRCRGPSGHRWVVGVDLGLPGLAREDLRDAELQRLPPRVDQDQEVVVEERRAIRGRVWVVGPVQVDSQRERAGLIPVRLAHPHPGRGEPAELVGLRSGEEAATAEHRMRLPELHQGPGELQQFDVDGRPVQPGDHVVLAVRVVVALLGVAELIAGQQQRDTERQEQRGQHGAGLPGSQRQHVRVGGLAFGPAVPGAVVAGAVVVGLAVRLVVLAVVGHQVPQREAVMHGEQVHRRGGPAPPESVVAAVQVGRAAEPGGELAEADLMAAPEVPHRVAVFPVPLAPQRREPADVVAVHLPDVPRLGDELRLRDHRVLHHQVEERG